jgi:hypothetical protein
MGKVDIYREQLRRLTDWELFLLKESGLPGPRGNIELAQAVAEERNEALFEYFLSFLYDMHPRRKQLWKTLLIYSGLT